MKRSYLYLLTILCTCVLALFSCRKDIDFYLKGKESPSSSVLENAKIHYLQNVNIESNNRLGANWKDSWIINKDGGEILIVPAPEIQQNNKNFSLRRFFAFRMKNEQVQNVNILELLGKGFDVEKNIDLLVSSAGNKIDGFNGSILLYDINYYPQKSYIYENGQLQKNKEASIVNISNLSTDLNLILKKASVEQSEKSVSNIATAPCPPVAPSWGNVVPPMAPDCTVSVYTETVRNALGCVTSITSYYQSHTCPAVCTSCGSGSGSGGGSGSGSGSGSGTIGGGNPPYGGGGTTEIKNRVANTCVKNMVNSVLNKNVEYTAKQSLNSIFGESMELNIYFQDNYEFPNNSNYGLCQVSNLTSFPNGEIKTMNAHIYLNSPVLSTMSQEIIALTTVHESIHAYLSYKGYLTQNNQAQHVVMLKNHVALMANYLITNFQTPKKEAYALSFGGLDVFDELTSSTKQSIINGLGADFPTQNERATIMAEYEMGYKGKKCP